MNSLEQLKKLLAELIAVADEVFKSGEQVPDEFWNEIADEIEATQAHIQQMTMQTQEIPEQQTPQQQLSEIANENAVQAQKQAPAVGLTQAMPSSNVDAFSYNPNTEDLYVRFLGDYPDRAGPIYKYGGVPLDTYKNFRKGNASATTEGENEWNSWHVGKNPSMGAAVNQMLKAGGFPYSKIS